MSYADLLSAAPPQRASEIAASQPALPAAGFLAAVARDEAAAAADGARDLLLLLAYLDNVRSLGTQTSTAWQSRVSAKVCCHYHHLTQLVGDSVPRSA